MLYFFSTYCHEFVTSFVAHLCLPSNVANTMQAIADGHAEKTTDVFLKTLKQNQHLQVCIVFYRLQYSG